MAHNKVSCEDHHWQRVWRGNTLSGYWIERCQRCGLERFVEPEDDYHTTIENTIVNQTGRERFTELEAERDALLAELAELQIYRDCVSRACRRYSALDETGNLVIPDGAEALVMLFRERDSLRVELLEAKRAIAMQANTLRRYGITADDVLATHRMDDVTYRLLTGLEKLSVRSADGGGTLLPPPRPEA